MPSTLFNAHHSPIGAFASFTLGEAGARGGFGLELGKPADQSVFIGAEEEQGSFRFLPFFAGAEVAGRRGTESTDDRETGDDDRARYQVGGAQEQELPKGQVRLESFRFDDISRDLAVSTDRWRAGDIELTIYSPVMPVPDPQDEACDWDALRLALLPAVFVSLSIDNRNGNHDRRMVFGFEEDIDSLYGMRRLDDTSDGRFVGIGQGRSTAIVSRDPDLISGQGFSVSEMLSEDNPENLTFAIGHAAALIGNVKAGEQRTFNFAVCFYRGGIVTAGWDTSYYYTRFWDSIEAVAQFALGHREELMQAALRSDERITTSSLSSDQKFMLAHAVRSYYGSTQLLQDAQGTPIWIVNEGEYRMMNTLDLTADQVFFEMAMNPWTVRNELDLFAERYSYEDQVQFPGVSGQRFAGGISFTHDMGVANVFSRPGFSSYEKYGLSGCFSHMTHEELVNWVCCALVYGNHDARWIAAKLPLMERCFASMLHRDDPDPTRRNGIMSLDSSRCRGGAEITTYDSLDASLGQSRGNIYLAGKCWAAYVGFEKAFRSLGRPDLAQTAFDQARRCEATICASALHGVLPAVIGEDVPARIIPAIEGLIFPSYMGCGEVTRADGIHGEYLQALKTHVEHVLETGICLFTDGGWKLSSTSDNSWLSKIYLCQHVAREVLGIDNDRVTAHADAAHVGWLLDSRNSYWCWSDQMVAGLAGGSRYYPRGVTSWLWLSQK